MHTLLKGIKASRPDAIAPSSGREFHGLITRWVQMHFLLSVLALPSLDFSGCPLVCGVAREGKEPPSFPTMQKDRHGFSDSCLAVNLTLSVAHLTRLL